MRVVQRMVMPIFQIKVSVSLPPGGRPNFPNGKFNRLRTGNGRIVGAFIERPREANSLPYIFWREQAPAVK